jgi:hypothetical protein
MREKREVLSIQNPLALLKEDEVPRLLAEHATEAQHKLRV